MKRARPFTFLLASALLIGHGGDSARSQPAPMPPKSVPQLGSEGEDFLLIEQSPRDEWIDLGPSTRPAGLGSRLLVRVAQGGKKWLLPVYVIKDLVVVENPKGPPRLVLSLYDALYHPQIESAVQAGMEKKFGKEGWEVGKPVNNEVTVTLWFDGQAKLQTLATSTFTRFPGKKEPAVEFAVTREVADLVSKADRSRLGVTFSERYRGRFRQSDLEATVTSASLTAVSFQNILDTSPDGQKASLLVAIGGSVNQSTAIRQMFRRQVAIDVMTRQGKEVNPTLLESLLGKLFETLRADTDLAKQKEDTVLTFVFSNGLKATASIGTFKGLKENIKTERKKIVDTAKSGSLETRAKREGEIDASAIGIFSAKVKLAWEDERKDTSSESLKIEIHDVDDMLKAIEGELPVAVLDAKQLQSVAARAQSELKFNMGTFRDGEKTLSTKVSLQPDVTEEQRAEADELAKVREQAVLKRKAVDVKAVELAAKIKNSVSLRGEVESTTKELHDIAGEIYAIGVSLSGEALGYGIFTGANKKAQEKESEGKYKTRVAEHNAASKKYFDKSKGNQEKVGKLGETLAQVDKLSKELAALRAELQALESKLMKPTVKVVVPE